MCRKRIHCGLAMLLLTAWPASGHEFWIEPSTCRPAPDERVSFRLFVGDGFPGEPYARNPRHIQRFDLIGPVETMSIDGTPGKNPAGEVRLARPGLHIAAYSSQSNWIELEAENFEAYLKEEGLEHVVRARVGERTESPVTRSSHAARRRFFS